VIDRIPTSIAPTTISPAAVDQIQGRPWFRVGGWKTLGEASPEIPTGGGVTGGAGVS